MHPGMWTCPALSLLALSSRLPTLALGESPPQPAAHTQERLRDILTQTAQESASV